MLALFFHWNSQLSEPAFCIMAKGQPFSLSSSHSPLFSAYLLQHLPPLPTPDFNPAVTSLAITYREKHQRQPRRSMSRESGLVDQFVIFLVAARGAWAMCALNPRLARQCVLAWIIYLWVPWPSGTAALGEGKTVGAYKCSQLRPSQGAGGNGGLMMMLVLNTLLQERAGQSVCPGRQRHFQFLGRWESESHSFSLLRVLVEKC